VGNMPLLGHSINGGKPSDLDEHAKMPAGSGKGRVFRCGYPDEHALIFIGPDDRCADRLYLEKNILEWSVIIDFAAQFSRRIGQNLNYG
jgi:hypothetical protein